MKSGMKIHTVTVGVLYLATLTTGGCVTSSTYDAAVADLETTKAELARARTQAEGITEQVSALEEHKNLLARQTEAASSALEQAKQAIEDERIDSQERLSKLARTISQLTVQQSGLRYSLQRATEEQARLQSTVDRYESTAAETEGFRSSLAPSPIMPAGSQAGTALAPSAPAPVPNGPAPQPTVTTPAALPDQTAANQTQQPAVKQTPEPVEEGWLPALKGWVISLWRSIFS